MCSCVKKVFLKISQSPQENICVGVRFLVKLQTSIFSISRYLPVNAISGEMYNKQELIFRQICFRLVQKTFFCIMFKNVFASLWEFLQITDTRTNNLDFLCKFYKVSFFFVFIKSVTAV